MSTADYSKRYQVKGVTKSGSKLAFPVSAFSHGEAVKKAKAKANGGKIHSVVLVTNKEKDRSAAIKAFKKLFK